MVPSDPIRVRGAPRPGPATAAVAVAALGLVAAASAAYRPAAVPTLASGIQIQEPEPGAWVEAVRQAGLDGVQVTLYARQGAWDGADLRFPREAPGVVAEIQAAREAGLKVALVLRVALEHALPENRHLWHGMIWPRQEVLEDWFRAYRSFALWGAELAQREGVEILALGSELNSLTSTRRLRRFPDLYAYFLDPDRTGAVRRRLVECAARVPRQWLEPDLDFPDGTRYPSLAAYLRAQEVAQRVWTRTISGALGPHGNPPTRALNRRRAVYEAFWRRLVAEVRERYRGPVTYAANFDAVEEVGFWDALDAVGVNAYYSLSRWGLQGAALDRELVASWRDVARRLQEVARRAGSPGPPRPVLFFELGWTGKAGSTVRPYSYHRVDVLESVGGEPGGPPPLRCVHWATQPDDPGERLRALQALLWVVEEGGFPALRGFTLWKLTTQPEQRAIEPFAVVLAPLEGGSGAAGRRRGQLALADRAYLATAAALAGNLGNGKVAAGSEAVAQ